ncbi:MAG: RNA polymerase sigma factor [Planctomycetaceae bacterium]
MDAALSAPLLDASDLLATHGRWLRTVVLARVGQTHALEEVMQEIAMAILRQTKPLVDPAQIAPWLYRVAVRQALLFRRKCGRTRRLLSNAAGYRTSLEAERLPLSPEEVLTRVERQQRVQEALQGMPPRDRDVLLLKYFEQWSYTQMAEHLGVSMNTIESRLFRARERMRARLSEP